MTDETPRSQRQAEPAGGHHRAACSRAGIIGICMLVLGACSGDVPGDDGLGAGGLLLVIILGGALIAAFLLAWNAGQKSPTPPNRQRRDLEVRIDQVVNGAHDVANRALSLIVSSDVAAVASSWTPLRTDMLALEGQVVNLAGHVGESPLGRCLAELDRGVRDLRGALESYVEPRSAASADGPALDSSRAAVTDGCRHVQAAVSQVEAARP